MRSAVRPFCVRRLTFSGGAREPSSLGGGRGGEAALGVSRVEMSAFVELDSSFRFRLEEGGVSVLEVE